VQLLRSKIGLGIAISAAALGCRAATSVPEPGAVLLRLTAPVGTPEPDELRVWVYQDGGPLWSDVRVPEAGALRPEAADRLGTILIQPGDARGALRAHVRGLAAGARVSDAVLVIPATDRARGTFDLPLDVAVPADGDGDDVPDAIDDCPAMADPAQSGCPDAGATDDGGADGPADGGEDAASDGLESGDAGGGDAPPGCDATGACDRPLGAVCSANPECASGYCVDGVCCANACVGPCRSCNQPNLNGTCQGYAAATDPEFECAAGTTCNGAGACGPASPPDNKANGTICGAASECASGFCKDGVCCNSACTSACQTCSTGTCKSVTRTADPPECGYPMTCNSGGRCTN
jgi:hypothetical protein